MKLTIILVACIVALFIATADPLCFYPLDRVCEWAGVERYRPSGHIMFDFVIRATGEGSE